MVITHKHRAIESSVAIFKLLCMGFKGFVRFSCFFFLSFWKLVVPYCCGVSKNLNNKEMELKNMIALVSRTGRHLQRYNKGRRQVVGCIPYRYRITAQNSLEVEEKIEVLVISSQKKGKGMLFPKGGWETDETMKEAASRETMEEAGVVGVIEDILGRWRFESKSQDAFYEGYMFPLLVNEEREFWPEKDVRERTWMSVKEAREVCQHGWMKQALDKLVERLESKQKHEKKEVRPCSLTMRPSKCNL